MDEIPYSTIYDDVYFSRAGGKQESEYVFLRGNRLPERWLDWNLPFFCIGETGFGTGLNFFTTLQSFTSTFPNGAPFWLHFVSVEGHPLTGTEIRRYLSVFPDLEPFVSEFLKIYSLPTPGFYRFHFPEFQATLTLLYGMAEDVLPELEAKIDAWYLDGFSPAKNPALWSDKIFREVRRLSHRGTTLASFTSASFVRRNLAAEGFSMNKEPGFGRKREMTVGVLSPNGDPSGSEPETSHSEAPKYRSWKKVFSIAGAGVAGASLARALSLRRIPVTVYDPRGVASQGSGNPSGIFYPYLTKFPIPGSVFSLHAFYYALQHFQDPTIQTQILAKGLIFLLDNDQKSARYRSAIENFQLPPTVAEYRTEPEHIFYPDGCSLSPPGLVKALLQGVDVRCEPIPDCAMESFDDFALCNSFDANSLLESLSCQTLPVRKVRGQLAILETSDLAETCTHPICCDTYISPIPNYGYVVGSTYDEFHPDRGWSADDDEKILTDSQKIVHLAHQTSEERKIWIEKRRRSILNEYFENIKTSGKSWKDGETEASLYVGKDLPNSKDSTEGRLYRVSHRAQSRDRLPILGCVTSLHSSQRNELSQDEGLIQNSGLSRDQGRDQGSVFNNQPETNARLSRGPWVYTALGSRGLVYSMLGGEVLASMILGEPLPIPRSLRDSLSPERFAKNLSKNLAHRSESES